MDKPIIWLAVLVSLSAFFSATETALTSLSRLKVRKLQEKGGRRYESLNQWLQAPERYLTAILIGNNIVNVAASVLAASISMAAWEDHGLAIATAGMTFILLVFAEIIPKTFARYHHEQLALLTFPPLNFFAWLIGPLVRLFTLLAMGLLRVFGRRLPGESVRFHTEDVRRMLEIGKEDGALDKEEKEIIDNVFEFRETVVYNIMTPRVDIVAVGENAPVSEVLSVMIEKGHSRLPVYGQGMDDILGMTDYRQVLSFYTSGKTGEPVAGFMRPAYFVPEGMRVSNLLGEFQRRKIHLAIVMDEYGGTSGLVTLEDLLEEFVGEIIDEHEKDPAEYQRVDELSFRINAKMEIEKVSELIGLDLEEDDESETLGGFVLNRLGHIPRIGEQFRYRNYLFTVEQSDERSVSLLLVQKLVPRHPAQAAG